MVEGPNPALISAVDSWDPNWQKAVCKVKGHTLTMTQKYINLIYQNLCRGLTIFNNGKNVIFLLKKRMKKCQKSSKWAENFRNQHSRHFVTHFVTTFSFWALFDFFWNFVMTRNIVYRYKCYSKVQTPFFMFSSIFLWFWDLLSLCFLS